MYAIPYDASGPDVDVITPISGNQKVIYKGTTAISFGNIFDTNFEVIYDGVTVTSTTTKSFGTITVLRLLDGNVWIWDDGRSSLVAPTVESDKNNCWF